MSLADQIVERNTNASPNPNLDEFGIPIPTPETPEYLVARALALNEWSLDEMEPRVHGLHLRGTALFRGHTQLKECRKTLLELTRLKRTIRDWEEAEFWRLLKQNLPTLYRRILEVAPDLYWDVDRAELINRQQAEERSKNG